MTEEGCCNEMAAKAKMFGLRCSVKRRKDKDDFWVFSVMGDRPRWRHEKFLESYFWTDSFNTGLIFIVVPTLDEAAKIVDEMCSTENV